MDNCTNVQDTRDITTEERVRFIYRQYSLADLGYEDALAGLAECGLPEQIGAYWLERLHACSPESLAQSGLPLRWAARRRALHAPPHRNLASQPL